MRRHARHVLLLCLLSGTVAAAGPRAAPQAVPLIALSLSPTAAADCRLGNTSTTTAFSGWWEGNESYAFLVDPREGECGCGLGVALRAVHLVLGVDPADAPVVQVKLMSAVVRDGCPRPGSVLDFSTALPLPPVSDAGYHELSLDVNFTCAETLEPYFVVVEFLDGNADGIDLVGGGQATPCRTWNDWGQGWYDLVADVGFTRDLSLWADFECCTAPVSATTRSWSEIKAGYLGERP